MLQLGIATANVEYAILTLAYLIIAAMVLVVILKSMSSLKRIEKVLNQSVEISDPKNSHSESLMVDSEAALVFEHVSFNYTKNSELVLKDIHFSVPKGKTTVIVGETGSGKGSIAKLILCLNEATSE